MRRYVLMAIATLFAALLFFAWTTWQQAQAFERETEIIITRLSAESHVEQGKNHLLELLSFGYYDNYSKQLEELNRHKELQSAYAESVEIMTKLSGGTALVLLVLAWFARSDVGDVAYAMLGIAFISLLVGLATPILSIEASKELPVLGDTLLQYQSKGVLSTLDTLYDNGYWWLALVLLIFSVVLPMMKTAVGGLTFFSRTSPLLERWFHISHHLGKWSMADVFVVAILVAFFANSGADSLTHAEVRPGLWFFLAYVLLSMLAFQLLGREMKRG
jgi:paraquat-inducible protein A